MNTPTETCSSWTESQNCCNYDDNFAEGQGPFSMFPIIDQDDDTQEDDQTQVTWSEQPIVPASLSETTHDFWVQHEAYSCEVCCTSPCRCPTCNSCGNVDRECTCRKCLFCQSSPLYCTCPRARDMPGLFYDRLTSLLSPLWGPIERRINRFGHSRLGQTMRPLVAPILWTRHQLRVRQARKAVSMEEEVPEGYVYVTRSEHVATMVEQLANLPTDKPNISFDMEANNLGHTSELSYIQIRGGEISYLVDLLVLQKAAWNTPSASDPTTTLRTIFEDPERTKLIFDCRQDSACLYAKANVRPRGVLDCQYLYMLTMNRCPFSRPGLAQTVQVMAGLSSAEFAAWNDTKKGPRSHGVWEKRPVPMQAKAYAVGDVALLRAIYDKAEAMLSTSAMVLAVEWSNEEVRRTWCAASRYTTTGRELTSGFTKCWDGELLKAGIEPNWAPRPGVSYVPY